MEGQTSDAGNAVRNGDARQATADTEGAKTNAGNAVRNGNTSKMGASPEGLSPDASNTFRDRVIGTFFAAWVSNKHLLLFIEKNPIDIRVS